jgi:hypothetical protein
MDGSDPSIGRGRQHFLPEPLSTTISSWSGYRCSRARFRGRSAEHDCPASTTMRGYDPVDGSTARAAPRWPIRRRPGGRTAGRSLPAAPSAFADRFEDQVGRQEARSEHDRIGRRPDGPLRALSRSCWGILAIMRSDPGVDLRHAGATLRTATHRAEYRPPCSRSSSCVPDSTIRP